MKASAVVSVLTLVGATIAQHAPQATSLESSVTAPAGQLHARDALFFRKKTRGQRSVARQKAKEREERAKRLKVIEDREIAIFQEAVNQGLIRRGDVAWHQQRNAGELRTRDAWLFKQSPGQKLVAKQWEKKREQRRKEDKVIEDRQMAMMKEAIEAGVFSGRKGRRDVNIQEKRDANAANQDQGKKETKETKPPVKDSKQPATNNKQPTKDKTREPAVQARKNLPQRQYFSLNPPTDPAERKRVLEQIHKTAKTFMDQMKVKYGDRKRGGLDDEEQAYLITLAYTTGVYVGPTGKPAPPAGGKSKTAPPAQKAHGKRSAEPLLEIFEEDKKRRQEKDRKAEVRRNMRRPKFPTEAPSDPAEKELLVKRIDARIKQLKDEIKPRFGDGPKRRKWSEDDRAEFSRLAELRRKCGGGKSGDAKKKGKRSASLSGYPAEPPTGRPEGPARP